ncbi:phosphoglucosamine mutase [Desulfobacteraceae bacterium SEEP-SAG9]|nr:phosphoglucosamine mutase [Desulfobacteraceae bacterium SEEP-SAG9]
MGNLFGTDGIRGVANEYPITSEMAVNIGRAVGSYFKGIDGKSKIIIGKDTRISGYMIEYAIVSGICSMGGDAYLTGILPTPGIALITSLTGANAGIVISASHNPFYDNGIKLFNQDGYKLSDENEAEIEQLLLKNEITLKCKGIRETGRVYQNKDAGKNYAAFLKGTLSKGCSFKGLKIVIDCSNGATYRIAPEIFDDLGAQIESIFINPDGKNINANCGSQHPEALARKVMENSADIGIAFDGDGDRLIVSDEKGNIIRGDQILAICARDMKQKGVLKNNILVSTVMSNMGLGVALKDMGIVHVKANVGDRYVLEKMVTTGAVLGGEDSGHMIFLNHHTTGDGILAALRLIEALQAEAKPLSELSQIMTVFPQVLLNVEVKGKPEIKNVVEIEDAIKSVEACLGEKGRVLVRYSGTQPLCRVMVEGPELDEVSRYGRQIAAVVEEKLG